MRHQRSRSVPSDVPPDRSDQMIQQAVLVVVLDLHPAQATVSELVRQIARDPADFGKRDGVERAVEDLAGIGLLHHHDFLNRPDALVAPTQAALVANELLTDEYEDE